jgi:hypothetical protein
MGYNDDKIKKDVIGVICSMHTGDKTYVQTFCQTI